MGLGFSGGNDEIVVRAAHLGNILKVTKLYTFKQVNCRLCELHLNKTVTYNKGGWKWAE